MGLTANIVGQRPCDVALRSSFHQTNQQFGGGQHYDLVMFRYDKTIGWACRVDGQH